MGAFPKFSTERKNYALLYGVNGVDSKFGQALQSTSNKWEQIFFTNFIDHFKLKMQFLLYDLWLLLLLSICESADALKDP